MKKLILYFFFTSLTCYSQETKLSISYEYIYSPQFDKSIQTYNFDRPFLKEKQPLFINGIHSNFNHTFKNEKQLKQGFSIGYSYFRSQANNLNFNNTLYLHFIQLGYLFHYQNSKRLIGFYENIQINCVLGGLFKNINDQATQFEEHRFKSLGIGGEIIGLIGYNFQKSDRLSPFISIGYSPYYFCPNTEALLNDSKGLIINPWVNYFKFNLGIAFKIK